MGSPLVSGIAALLFTFVLLTGCKTTERGAAEPPSGTAGGTVNKGPTEKVDFLFVQTATGVTFDNGNTMTLHGLSPMTVCFADRPERIAGHMPSSRIVPMWGEGKNSFLANPPNASLSVMTWDSVKNVVVELRNPRINGADLTYDVRTLEGTPTMQSGPCSLFIDIIGMPLTPYSYAGAARRAARRGYLYPGVYGPAIVAPRPVVVAPAAVVY